MKSVKETVKIRVCKGGSWERVDGVLEYMPLNWVKRTLILPLLPSYSCLLEAVFERLEIDANSGFMVTYNSDNDIVEVCDDLEVNEFMKFVVKSSRIVTLCIVESSVNGRQSLTTGSNQQSNFIRATPFVVGSPKNKRPNERDLLDDEKLRPFREKIIDSVFGKVKRLSGEDESSESDERRVMNLMRRVVKQHPLRTRIVRRINFGICLPCSKHQS
ncbi:hypothetical protein Tco_0237341 [Tanacetum coccineum]